MILIAYGTRPEIIKLFPVIAELQRRGLPFRTLFTGQHLDLYRDVQDLVPAPDFGFGPECGRAGSLGASFAAICLAADQLFHEHPCNIVAVQGDTTTAWALAQAAFYNGVKVAHVEAGLRTHDLQNPYPEEANRRLISTVAELNFAATERAAQTLAREGARNILRTGNTIVDAVRRMGLTPSPGNLVPITIHRRENHAQIEQIFAQLNEAARRHPELDFFFPMHPNPNVRRHRGLLAAPNLRVGDPVGYREMLALLSRARFIISDSGGIQEEALCFGKKVLVVRKTTERPETIEAGYGRLVDSQIVAGLDWALAPAEPSALSQPYGDGHAASRIVDALAEFAG